MGIIELGGMSGSDTASWLGGKVDPGGPWYVRDQLNAPGMFNSCIKITPKWLLCSHPLGRGSHGPSSSVPMYTVVLPRIQKQHLAQHYFAGKAPEPRNTKASHRDQARFMSGRTEPSRYAVYKPHEWITGLT
jgi:hypothetical protein